MLRFPGFFLGLFVTVCRFGGWGMGVVGSGGPEGLSGMASGAAASLPAAPVEPGFTPHTDKPPYEPVTGESPATDRTTAAWSSGVGGGRCSSCTRTTIVRRFSEPDDPLDDLDVFLCKPCYDEIGDTDV